MDWAFASCRVHLPRVIRMTSELHRFPPGFRELRRVHFASVTYDSRVGRAEERAGHNLLTINAAV